MMRCYKGYNGMGFCFRSNSPVVAAALNGFKHLPFGEYSYCVLYRASAYIEHFAESALCGKPVTRLLTGTKGIFYDFITQHAVFPLIFVLHSTTPCSISYRILICQYLALNLVWRFLVQ